MPIGAA
jgi:hypothetical protein